jgi:hypothetical protein
VRAKEANLLMKTSQIKTNLSRLAQQKFAREMENFSDRYRQLRQGNLTRPLFEQDFSTVRPEIAELGFLASRFEGYPLSAQSVIKSEDVVRVAEKVVEVRARFVNLECFREILETCTELDKEVRLRFELCVRLITCIACFDAKVLLVLLVDNTDDRDRVIEIFDTAKLDTGEIE